MASSAGERRVSPYIGLSPYDEDDADLFFGRRAEQDLVVANLLTSRLTVLYGPSGVGKSSLLRAGVLPRLRTGAGLPGGGSPRSVALVDSWRGDPVRAIASAVAAAGGGEEAIADGAPFDEALARHGERHGGILLLVFDQFEDYFLYHADGDDRLRDELPLALARADVRARVLIALREDALASLDRLGGSTGPLFGNLVRLGPMSDRAAREAITEPAARADSGLTLEPGLPDHVLALLHEGRGAARGQRPGGREGIEPAYLQLVMRRLWELESAAGSTVLREATLRSMGDLRDIVGEHLTGAMDRLTPPERRAMADAFHYLVTPSGAKIAQRRDDLARLTDREEQALAAPLEKLAAGPARILRPVDDAPSYELFHDVLAQPLLDWQARFRAARLQRRAAALGAAVAAAVAIVLALVAYILEPELLQHAELRTIDARFALRGDVAVPADIVVVDLDDAGLAALGGGAARIPRELHARMIDNLRAAGAAVIAYDIEFLERMPGDVSLRPAIERAGPQLLLAATRLDSDGQGQILGDAGGRLPASVGYAGFPLAADDAYRQVDESVGLSGAERSEAVSQRLPSFAVVAAELAGDPPEPFERAWIDYHGPARTFPYHRFAEVLRGADPGRFEGKIVVVGASARAQRDVHPTAYGGRRAMSGAEIQANAISTLRRGRPLREAATGIDLVLVVLFGMLPALLVIALRPAVAAGLALVAVLVLLAGAQLAFSAGWIVPVVYPLVALLLSVASVFTLGLALGRRTRTAP